jgi:hypothetical protein
MKNTKGDEEYKDIICNMAHVDKMIFIFSSDYDLRHNVESNAKHSTTEQENEVAFDKQEQVLRAT